ncbi:MAG TPA: sigma 54-interacting transcriptional regulator [Candidatus Hydrogenedentes bacterium]|nr:sigma 54-interacting transcriptional regulator [Candidatus Hydrogenedentota bacterium]HQM47293.1 sigma 54-interacting transcriptional regulator [Candidatus Hydrogenedentota bacterium]
MQLVSIGGRTKGACWILGERGLTLGREEGNDIVLDDPIVSRRHCRFLLAGGQIRLEDLGCRNPLLVNGLPMRTGVLETGDEVTIGGERFLLVQSHPETDARKKNEPPSDTKSIDLRRPIFLGADGSVDAEQESPRTIQDLLALQQIVTRLARCRNREEFTTLLKRALKERFRPLALWILSSDEQQGLFVLDEEVTNAEILPSESVHIALREKRGFLSVNPQKTGDETGVSFTLITPVIAGGTIVGALVLLTGVPHGVFVEDDLRLLVLLGQSLGPVFWTVEDMEQLRRDNEYLRARAGESLSLVGNSKSMRQVRQRIGLAAKSELSVLITGETGTGKELAARLIHQQSSRKRGPFVTVNCAAIPHELFESFMFGYERGAFTGADRSSRGFLAEAHGGIIFLDEVGDLSLSNQARILRSIEYGTYRRPGADQDSRVDVRVVSATNRDLRAAAQQGAFREDLFHRLNGFEISLPPLRERVEDIPELAQHFFELAKQQAKRPVRAVAPEAMEILQTQNWTGNVRELRNCILRAVSIAQGDTIRAEDALDNLSGPRRREEGQDAASLADIEKKHIAHTMTRYGGNVSKAAKALGISRSTLYEKLRLYELNNAG